MAGVQGVELPSIGSGESQRLRETAARGAITGLNHPGAPGLIAQAQTQAPPLGLGSLGTPSGAACVERRLLRSFQNSPLEKLLLATCGLEAENHSYWSCSLG